MGTTIKLTPKQIALARGDDDEYESLSGSAGSTMAGDISDSLPDSNGDDDDGSSFELSDQEDDRSVSGGDEGVSGSGSGTEGLDDSEAGPAWLKAGDLDYAKSYGLSAEDLSQFNSRAELQRFGRLTDQRMLQSRKFFPGDSQDDGKEQGSTQDASKADAEQNKAGGKVSTDDVDLELVDPEKYVAANYDDETVALAKALRKTQELLKSVLPVAQSISKTQESEQQKSRDQYFDEFEKALDSYSDPLFGVSGKDGSKLLTTQTDNRQAVWVAMREIQATADQAAIAKGQSPTQIPVGILVERARNMLFTENTGYNKNAIKEQSKRRRPASGGNRGSQMPSGEAEPDSAAAIAKSPKVKEFWQRVQRQNGMG